MGKVIRFEVDGEPHEMELRRPSRPVLMLFASLQNFEDTETDFGVEAFVKTIDGAHPDECDWDVAWDAWILAQDFLDRKYNRLTSSA